MEFQANTSGTAAASDTNDQNSHLLMGSPCDAFDDHRREICLGIQTPGMPRYTAAKREAFIRHWLATGQITADPRTAADGNVQQIQQDHRNQYRRPPKPENDLNRLCRHRGEQTGTTHCKPCQSRTGKREDVAVFACSVHGECTLYQTGKAKLPGCNKCHEFEAVDGQ